MVTNGCYGKKYFINVQIYCHIGLVYKDIEKGNCKLHFYESDLTTDPTEELIQGLQ